MKKYITIFLTIFILFCLSACSNNKEDNDNIINGEIEPVDEPIDYGEVKLNEFGKYTGDGWSIDNGTLMIDKDLSDISIKRLWGPLKDNIIKVIINEGVVNLPDASFYECYNLENVYIYGKISITESDFNRCDNLKEVYIQVNDESELSEVSVNPLSFRNCKNCILYFDDVAYYIEHGVFIPIPTKYLNYLDIEVFEAYGNDYFVNGVFPLIKVSEKTEDESVSNHLFTLNFMNVISSEKYSYAMYADEYPFALGVGDYAGNFFVLNTGSDIIIDLTELLKIYSDFSGIYPIEDKEIREDNENIEENLFVSDYVDRLVLKKWVEEDLLESIIDINASMEFSMIDVQYPIDDIVEE